MTRIETTFDSVANLYVMRVVRADGTDATEEFGDATAFEGRLHVLERELAESRWVQEGGPRLLADGWRI